MGNYTRDIDYAIKQYPHNEIIVAREFYKAHFPEMPELAYYKALERLTTKGTLEHLAKGVYSKPLRTEYGVQSITEEDILRHFIADGRGVVIGYRLYNREGITQTKKEPLEVLSTNMTEDKKTVRNVVVYRVDMKLDQKIIPVLETLEILQNYNKIENVDNGGMIAYMKRYAEGFQEDVVDYVLAHKKYKKVTIAFLKAFLDHLQKKNHLDRYLSTLSKYAYPSMKEIFEK